VVGGEIWDYEIIYSVGVRKVLYDRIEVAGRSSHSKVGGAAARANVPALNLRKVRIGRILAITYSIKHAVV
jgi:hypothetical protein